MKRKIVFVTLALLVIAVFFAYSRFFAPATQFSGKEKIFYIYSRNATKDAILVSLIKDSVVHKTGSISWLGSQMSYWEKIKPGRYKITSGMSVYAIIKQLRSGVQTPSRLVINKLRLTQDLGKLLDKAIEADSAEVMEFMNDNDEMKKLELDNANLMAYIIPDTYEVLWTWSPERVLQKLKEDRERWWNKKDRKALTQKIGLSQNEVHTLASIVEEETNKKDDKPKVASVYLNRLKIGMPLQADPTIRYALKNFTMNRILYVHLRTPSPYNTYINKGLPPGPICTPSPATIDAVLNAPQTEYIFFVANADLMGGSTFTTNLSDHNKAARVYQDSLSAWLKRKAIREKTKKDSIAKSGSNTTQ